VVRKIRETKNFCRERIASPKKFDKRSFRVLKPNKNTRVTVACPKGKFQKGKCKVGLKTQSIARRKVNGGCKR